MEKQTFIVSNETSFVSTVLQPNDDLGALLNQCICSDDGGEEDIIPVVRRLISCGANVNWVHEV